MSPIYETSLSLRQLGPLCRISVISNWANYWTHLPLSGATWVIRGKARCTDNVITSMVLIPAKCWSIVADVRKFLAHAPHAGPVEFFLAWSTLISPIRHRTAVTGAAVSSTFIPPGRNRRGLYVFCGKRGRSVRHAVAGSAPAHPVPPYGHQCAPAPALAKTSPPRHILACVAFPYVRMVSQHGG